MNVDAPTLQFAPMVALCSITQEPPIVVPLPMTQLVSTNASDETVALAPIDA
jgi:hypothetical protein